MKYSELERKLQREGCYFKSGGRRHAVWFSPITGKRFLMSNHKSEEVAAGTLGEIIKYSGAQFVHQGKRNGK
ncbi:type II toxin-antitoxin system HicA family toxin [Treponema endosymbiont of Eucomonympha sp.]|uniref:type II toxin-antitoxin system HicA family toxin n=1 Tax=Treponema endosymbiont of Eucomonympha sp. TaxID=1580831 RepID=UPI0007513841|nr:type II toxin-antitoxin system HicA family toxin [Treponema endosymbiont of Eucomonympha sp.]